MGQKAQGFQGKNFTKKVLDKILQTKGLDGNSKHFKKFLQNSLKFLFGWI